MALDDECGSKNKRKKTHGSSDKDGEMAEQ